MERILLGKQSFLS